MKITKFLSVLFVFMLGVSAVGCENRKDADDGEISSRTKASYKTSGKTKYDFENYSFEISNDFTLKNEVDADKLEFSGKYFDELTIYSLNNRSLTARAEIKSNYDSYIDFEDYSDVSYEFFDELNYNAGALHYTLKQDSENVGVSHYMLSCQTQVFSIIAGYAPKNKDKVQPMLYDILASVVRTSDFTLPTEPQDFDCDYFSIHYDPKWHIDDEGLEKTGESVKFTYLEVDDPDKYLFPNVSIGTYVLNDDDDTAAKRADDLYERNSDRSLISDVKRDQKTILGYNCEYVEYLMDVYFIRKYYFDHNGVIYHISTSINNGSESDEKDIEELLSGIVIKDLTAEDIERKAAEAEAAKAEAEAVMENSTV